MTLLPKAKPTRDPKYLAWLREQACAWCAKRPPSEASHHGPHGIGTKADDHGALPLCGPWGCHSHFHRTGVLPKLSPATPHRSGSPTVSGAAVREWAAEKAKLYRERYLASVQVLPAHDDSTPKKRSRR